MEIKIVSEKLRADDVLPKTLGAAGIDLYATNIENDTTVLRGVSLKINTGIRVAIPEHHVGLIMPRSSTGIAGYSLANTVGVIDSDYRGDVMVVLKNTNDTGAIIVEPMQRIAQLVVVPCYAYRGALQVVDELDATERGEGGFGSTGT